MAKQINSHDYEDIYKDLNIDLDTLGCVMLDVNPLDTMLVEHVSEADLYVSKNPSRPWISGWVAGKVAHVTLLYGLLDNAHNWSDYIKKILEGAKLDTVRIKEFGFFESPYIDDEDSEYYCLVAHIETTPELIEAHNRLELLPHINTFVGYKPHMTICYIRKNEWLRDHLIGIFNGLWAGKELSVSKDINLGYEPKAEGKVLGATVKRTFILSKEDINELKKTEGDHFRYVEADAPCYELEDGTILYGTHESDGTSLWRRLFGR